MLLGFNYRLSCSGVQVFGHCAIAASLAQLWNRATPAAHLPDTRQLSRAPPARSSAWYSPAEPRDTCLTLVLLQKHIFPGVSTEAPKCSTRTLPSGWIPKIKLCQWALCELGTVSYAAPKLFFAWPSRGPHNSAVLCVRQPPPVCKVPPGRKPWRWCGLPCLFFFFKDYSSMLLFSQHLNTVSLYSSLILLFFMASG